jgi:hypothetical protein
VPPSQPVVASSASQMQPSSPVVTTIGADAKVLPVALNYRPWKTSNKLALSGGNYAGWRLRFMSHLEQQFIPWPPANPSQAVVAMESIFSSVDGGLVPRNETDPVKAIRDLDLAFVMDGGQATTAAFAMLHDLKQVASGSSVRGLMARLEEVASLGSLSPVDPSLASKFLQCLPPAWSTEVAIWRSQRLTYAALRHEVTRKLRDCDLVSSAVPTPAPPDTGQVAFLQHAGRGGGRGRGGPSHRWSQYRSLDRYKNGRGRGHDQGDHGSWQAYSYGDGRGQEWNDDDQEWGDYGWQDWRPRRGPPYPIPNRFNSRTDGGPPLRDTGPSRGEDGGHGSAGSPHQSRYGDRGGRVRTPDARGQGPRLHGRLTHL